MFLSQIGVGAGEEFWSEHFVYSVYSNILFIRHAVWKGPVTDTDTLPEGWTAVFSLCSIFNSVVFGKILAMYKKAINELWAATIDPETKNMDNVSYIHYY